MHNLFLLFSDKLLHVQVVFYKILKFIYTLFGVRCFTSKRQ